MFKLNSATSYLTDILIGFILLYYVIFIYKNLKLLKFSWTTNGFMVPILPFLGHAYMLYLGFIFGSRNNVLSASALAKKIFGFPCSIWLGHHYLLLNSDPEEIKLILSDPKSIDKPIPFYKDFHAFSKNCLFLLPYEQWKPRRKHFLKSYRPKVLKTYQQTFYKQSCELLGELKGLKPEDDLFIFFNKYSFTNFFLTSVGLEEEKVDYEQIHEFGHLVDQMQELSASQIMNPILPMKIWMRYFPNGRKLADCLGRIRTIVFGIIQEKKKQHAYFQEYTENANELPLMDSMLYVEGKQMSDDQIFEEMLLFSAAATETSGHTMAFCFTCLGMYPEVQETLYNEVMAVIGQNTISNDDLPNLKYTEAVVLETLRIFPALPLVGRYFSADIDVGTRIIPKGTNYIISVFDLHRNPKYWPNPFNFDPTRFLPGKFENIQPYTYLAFSGGPRDCIGKVQAMMLMKTTLANVIRNFKITSNMKSLETFCLASCLTMKATHPLDCHFTPR